MPDLASSCILRTEHVDRLHTALEAPYSASLACLPEGNVVACCLIWHPCTSHTQIDTPLGLLASLLLAEETTMEADVARYTMYNTRLRCATFNQSGTRYSVHE